LNRVEKHLGELNIIDKKRDNEGKKDSKRGILINRTLIEVFVKSSEDGKIENAIKKAWRVENSQG